MTEDVIQGPRVRCEFFGFALSGGVRIRNSGKGYKLLIILT
jgi:hypothetical protein